MPVDFLDFFYSPLQNFIANFWKQPIYLVEVAVIIFILWKIYHQIKGTQAEQLLKGILVIVAALLLSHAFKLIIISKILEYTVMFVVLGAVVIFQPELRRVLGHLGQSSVFARNLLGIDSGIDPRKTVVPAIVESVRHLSKTHTGALIVLEDILATDTFLEVGTPIKADISVELILTIFHPNTPLHDGAIVVNGNKIIAAGVLLPLTEDPKLSWQYGTRHRAAIGMSEISNALCIVVSEETGELSMARNGELKKYPGADELKKALDEIYKKLYPSQANKVFSAEKIKNILNADFTKLSDIIGHFKKPSDKLSKK